MPKNSLIYQPRRPSLALPGIVLADITPVILTYNEAANIGRTLERLAWAKEVVVVDSNSADDTLAIAGRFANVRALQRPFDTHARQWHFAVEETGIISDWVLRLDADYMVEPALRDEIAALAPAADTAAYEIAFTYCIDGRPLRASLYPALPVLFRRGRGRFVQDGHTEKLRIDGPIVKLNNRLLHDDRKSLERWLQSQSRYQAQEAEKLTSRPWSELSWPDRLRRTRFLGPIAVAVHCLFVKGLIFDGAAGLLYTAQRVTADLILSMHLLRRDLDR
ncbi:MAG: glycosyltransferase [Rhodospirillales bacterium]|nr:glycosyltransferase [Rhodospirillales bacterium]